MIYRYFYLSCVSAFQWVSGDKAQVQIVFESPLPDDLPLTHVGLLTDGVTVETFPAAPTLPPQTPYTVTLSLRPEGEGKLNINGMAIFWLWLN